MGKIVNRMIVILAICALMSGVALAKVKSRVVTFGQDFIVGSTVVKKGTYKLVFDDQTNELTIMEKKTVIAKALARLEKRTSSTLGLDIKFVADGDRQVLSSVAFPGDDRSIVISDGGGQTAKS
ncbi:MAG TPA: hypothetical protein VD966_11580 [Pyrinomonadaceae bacterium]|nr:hypothetical protein [Pyrinomonadaceae bacterium]